MITLNDDLNFSRNDLVEFLEDNNIQTRNLFAGNILRHPLFKTVITSYSIHYTKLYDKYN